ncbi:PP2C family protein-serine/threonine phosphatase [Streptomyces sp. ODS05-4]|uniref:PP2C family protein-serine/threonine phosphatase n=1 Tax=Streptomyces sp. ODS05-4 TaxID=2944939 RepID=UPI002109CA82|nr:PP2C family protein-serine/threonine phosphatase [Streptomyces sp. ODS05-4]
MTRFTAVERALRTAAPHDFLPVLRQALATHYSVVDVELLMADYALTILQPVTTLPYTRRPVPVHGTRPGHAFAWQQPCTETQGTRTVVHLPVSVRGDRLGILTVTLDPEHLDEAVQQELQDIAQVLGHEIAVGERDTDLYLQARRANRLTLAAEMQWQLLPGRTCVRPEYTIGAQLEPAYAIYGDNFDWSTTAHDLTLTVTNGMGEGIEAALLTNLAINALRNARRAGLSLTDQAYLADQAVYGQHQGAQHLSVLLLRFDLATGATEIVDAGSPRMWRLRDGRAEPVELEAQLPLGMFEDTHYTAEQHHTRPGDRLVFVSDGVYDVASPAGERYSERALARALTSTRLLPASHVPRAVLHELTGHRGPVDAADDAMVVCLDWRGRPLAPGSGETPPA